MTFPGNAVGAGFAVTDGAKEPTFTFSVGDTEAGLDSLLEGLLSEGFSLLQAVNAPVATRAAAPAPSAI